ALLAAAKVNAAIARVIDLDELWLSFPVKVNISIGQDHGKLFLRRLARPAPIGDEGEVSVLLLASKRASLTVKVDMPVVGFPVAFVLCPKLPAGKVDAGINALKAPLEGGDLLGLQGSARRGKLLDLDVSEVHLRTFGL